MDGRMLGSKEVMYVKGGLLLSKGWDQCLEPRSTTSTYKAIYKILSPNPRTWGKILIMLMFMELMLMACGTIWKRRLLKRLLKKCLVKRRKKISALRNSKQKGLEAGGRRGVGLLVCSECLI